MVSSTSCPSTTSVAAGSPQIYSWTNWNSTPYLAYSAASGDPVVAAFSGKRIGDTIAVTGSGVNTLILAGVGASANYVLFHTADGVNFTPTVVTNITGLPTVPRRETSSALLSTPTALSSFCRA